MKIPISLFGYVYYALAGVMILLGWTTDTEFSVADVGVALLLGKLTFMNNHLRGILMANIALLNRKS